MFGADKGGFMIRFMMGALATVCLVSASSAFASDANPLKHNAFARGGSGSGGSYGYPPPNWGGGWQGGGWPPGSGPSPGSCNPFTGCSGGN